MCFLRRLRRDENLISDRKMNPRWAMSRHLRRICRGVTREENSVGKRLATASAANRAAQVIEEQPMVVVYADRFAVICPTNRRDSKVLCVCCIQAFRHSGMCASKSTRNSKCRRRGATRWKDRERFVSGATPDHARPSNLNLIYINVIGNKRTVYSWLNLFTRTE